MYVVQDVTPSKSVTICNACMRELYTYLYKAMSCLAKQQIEWEGIYILWLPFIELFFLKQLFARCTNF